MTKIVTCPKCGHQVVGDKEVCPKCNEVLTTCSPKSFIPVLKYFLGILVIIGIAFFYFLNSGDKINFPGKPLSYKIIDTKINAAANPTRERLYVTAYLKGDQSTATQNDLITTAMKIALAAHEKQSLPIIAVVLLSSNSGNTYTDMVLADVTYSPDEMDYDAKEKVGKFFDANASMRGYTKDELAVLAQYGKLKYEALQKEEQHTDLELVEKAIQQTGLKVDPQALLANTRQVMSLK